MRRQHYTQSQDHHFCRDCDRLFSSEELRIKHSATKHLYCRAHDTVRLSVRLNTSSIETDGTALIQQTFKSEDDLVSHYRQSLEHPFCVTCECNFDNENALWVHSEKDHHACGQCRKVSVTSFLSFPPSDLTERQCYRTFTLQLFDSHEGLQEHDRNKHDFCTDCKRGFQSASDLRHHLTIEHAAAKNWYYQVYDWVNIPVSAVYNRNLCATQLYSSSNLKMLPNPITYRVWVTTFAQSARRSSMMRMNYGSTQRMTMTPAAIAMKSVFLSPHISLSASLRGN